MPLTEGDLLRITPVDWDIKGDSRLRPQSHQDVHLCVTVEVRRHDARDDGRVIGEADQRLLIETGVAALSQQHDHLSSWRVKHTRMYWVHITGGKSHTLLGPLSGWNKALTEDGL